MKKVIAHGTFDILHFGHLNYLEKAKSLGDYLIVLVTSDNLALEHNKNPYFNENIRKRMILSLRIVDEVILRTNRMVDALKDLNADLLVTTDKALASKTKNIIETKIIPKTPGISSSILKTKIINKTNN